MDEKREVLRPGSGIWALVAIAGIALALPFLAAHRPFSPGARAVPFPTPAGVEASLGCLVVCFAIPAAVGIAFALRARIEADARGLRWRGLRGGWQQASWESVADYGVVGAQADRWGTRRPSHYRVEIADGRALRFGPDRWGDSQRLRARIATQAHFARAAGIWGLLGARPVDPWPQTFGYDDPALPSQKRCMNGGMVVGSVALVALIVRLLSAPEGWTWWNLGAALTAATVFGMLLLLRGIVLRITLGGYRTHREERWTLDRVGFTFGRGECAWRVTWADVRALRLVDAGFGRADALVETEAAIYHFTPQIARFRQLTAACAAFAPHAGSWRDERTVSQPLTPTVATGGRRIFHFRTRATRALLACVLALSLAPTLAVAVRRLALGDRLPGSDEAMLTLSGILLIPVACGFWCFVAARIEVDADGMRQFRPFGCRRLAWAAVRSLVKREEMGIWQVTGADGERIAWPAGFLADEADLLALLRARAQEPGPSLSNPPA